MELPVGSPPGVVPLVPSRPGNCIPCRLAGESSPNLPLELTPTEVGPSPRSPIPEAGAHCPCCSSGWLAKSNLPPVQGCREEGVPCDSAVERTKVSVPLAPAGALLLKAVASFPPPTSSFPDVSLGCWAETLPRGPRDLLSPPIREEGHLVPPRWLLLASFGINGALLLLSRVTPALLH